MDELIFRDMTGELLHFLDIEYILPVRQGAYAHVH